MTSSNTGCLLRCQRPLVTLFLFFSEWRLQHTSSDMSVTIDRPISWYLCWFPWGPRRMKINLVGTGPLSGRQGGKPWTDGQRRWGGASINAIHRREGLTLLLQQESSSQNARWTKTKRACKNIKFYNETTHKKFINLVSINLLNSRERIIYYSADELIDKKKKYLIIS